MANVPQNLRKYEVFFAKGIDQAVSVSYPQISLIPRAEWIKDENAQACMLCATRFTMLNRRHHCRRCGRVLCDKCCPKSFFREAQEEIQDRQCKLCCAYLDLDRTNLQPEDYDIIPYFEAAFVYYALNGPDLILFTEALRLLQNTLRNARTRSHFINTCDGLIQKMCNYYKHAMDTLAKGQRFEFIDGDMTSLRAEDAKRMISAILGVCINITACDRDENVNALIKYPFIELMIQAILAPTTDLVRQEQAAWALRNFSQTEDAAKQLTGHKYFTKMVFTLFKTNVKNIVDSTCIIVANACQHNPALIDQFLNKGTSAGTVGADQFFDDLVQTLGNAAPYQRAAIINLFAIFTQTEAGRKRILGADLLAQLVKIIYKPIGLAQKDKSAPDAAYENYVSAATLKAFNSFICNFEDEYTQQLLAKLLCNSVSTMSGIIARVQELQYYCCVEASKLLKLLFEKMYAQTYRIVSGSKDVKEIFIKTVSRAHYAHFPIASVRNDCREIIYLLENGDDKTGLIASIAASY